TKPDSRYKIRGPTPAKPDYSRQYPTLLAKWVVTVRGKPPLICPRLLVETPQPAGRVERACAILCARETACVTIILHALLGRTPVSRPREPNLAKDGYDNRATVGREPLIPEIRVTPQERWRLVLVGAALLLVLWLLKVSFDALGPFIL